MIFDFSWKSYAWIVTRGNEEWTALKISAQELETQVMTLRESLALDENILEPKPFETQLAYKLYQEIFAAFADKIASKKQILVVANLRRRVPFLRRNHWRVLFLAV